MSGDHSDDGVGDDELRVTDLTPREARDASLPGSRVARWRQARVWRWAPLAVSLILLTALALSSLPQSSVLLGALRQLGHPTPTVVESSVQIIEEVSPSPLPTTVLQTLPPPPLDQAPTWCWRSPAPPLAHVGPPQWGGAIGHAPIWMAGFSGANPTLRLGDAARANAYSWNAPYTQFGWPAPIGLVMGQGFSGPVILSGWNVATQEPVSFGFVVAGQWGAPSSVNANYVLDPSNPDLPAGGADSTGVFWYGYAFVPKAGCYTITASSTDESWHFTVSAGR